MSKVTPFDPARRAPAESTTVPLPTLDELLSVERQALAFAARYQGLEPIRLPTGSSLVPATAERWRADALTARRRLPTRAAAFRAREPVLGSLRTRATPEVTRMIVGQLLSCYPNDKVGNPQMAFEALVFDLIDTGHSDVVVAAACTRLRRTSKFRPAISEVLDACGERRRTFEGVGSLIGRLLRAMGDVHDVLHHSGGDPDPAEIAFHCPLPGLEAEYAKGSSNRYWYDIELNHALVPTSDQGGHEETDEEWATRVQALKAAADANPAGTVLAIARAEGGEAGRMVAEEFARRSGMGSRRAGADKCMRLAVEQFPGREPREVYQTWLVAADGAFMAVWDDLLPDYDVQERARERAESERQAAVERQRRGRAR